MTIHGSCPIWRTPAQLGHGFSRLPGSSGNVAPDVREVIVSSRVGGGYSLTRDVRNQLRKIDDYMRARLTTWIAEQRSFGVECPHINLEVFQREISRRPLTVNERADRLLKYIRSKTPHLGDALLYYPGIKVTPADKDYEMLAVSESINKKELTYLIEFLTELRFLTTLSSDNERYDFTISPTGYAHLAELETKSVSSDQAFVAMWFDSSMDNLYFKGIAPGIEKAGYKPMRIDKKVHNNKIDDEIIAEIRRSRFIVADFTQGDDGARGGVYYEAGFARGLNIQVFSTCSADSIKDVHFDTNHYLHLLWSPDDFDNLSDKLAVAISATIGDGPLKKIL